MGNSQNGRNIIGIIGAWLIGKSLLNLILGFGMPNIVTLIILGGLAYAMYSRLFPYSNYVTAGITAVTVLMNLIPNIQGGQWLYLLEAAVDCVCVYFLVLNKDVKAYLGQG